MAIGFIITIILLAVILGLFAKQALAVEQSQPSAMQTTPPRETSNSQPSVHTTEQHAAIPTDEAHVG
ncbi:hypothetical protein AAC03nite_14020 [Alicyclobacillus acidoterrestris]|uniref:hypothetical protein n=1 Tax=Alicyclobacillus suci TaxID=2816080 RepID=UPI00118F5AA2|nr:hypothetical protein [Alicyclobacillus suci]GEO25617.1 hypothetical protein AAC03nite_14020 [Alicyclobacillus acidoterrestris]